MGLLSTFGAASGRAYGFTRSAIAAATDAFFNRVTLLLPGNGTNGAQNNTFLDSSSNNFTITRNGNTTQGTFSPFSQTGWSNYFGGSSDYLTFADNAAWYLTGDYTIECWVYINAYPSVNTSAVFAQWQDGGGNNRNVSLNIDTSGVTTFYQNFNGTNYSPASSTLNRNTWYHIAIGLSGTSLVMWVNGTRTGSATTVSGSRNDSTYVFAIGADSGGAYKLNGYVSNFRLVKGTDVYGVSNSTITVPTSPLTAITNTQLLTCQSNRFIDNSANAFAITVNGTPSVQAFSPFAPTAAYSAATNGGSGYFDGTGDYLSSTISAIAGTFTIEFWFYRPASGSNFCFTIGDSQTGGNTSAEVYIGTSGTVLNYWTNNAAQITGTPAPSGQWVYLAVTRDASNVVRLYQNGTQVGGTYTQSGTLSTALRIGTEWYGGASTGTTNGYIGHFRVSNNVRTVTTVPTSPFSSDANTVFLANFTNGGITDATAKNDLETVGNAQISTTQSKFGGSSMYFDGTGDYLSSPSSQNYAFGTGDFTIEFWVYSNDVSSASNKGMMQTSAATGGLSTTFTNGVFIAFGQGSTAGTGNNGGVYARINNNHLGGNSAAATGAWYHIALTRASGTARLFVNGTQIATISNSSDVTATNLAVGGYYDTNQLLNGYIDDLRITKGYARYTANFTAPTAAFALQ